MSISSLRSFCGQNATWLLGAKNKNFVKPEMWQKISAETQENARNIPLMGTGRGWYFDRSLFSGTKTNNMDIRKLLVA